MDAENRADGWDCPHPEWRLTELHLTLDHAGQARVCTVCGAVRYDDARQQRPGLD